MLIVLCICSYVIVFTKIQIFFSTSNLKKLGKFKMKFLHPPVLLAVVFEGEVSLKDRDRSSLVPHPRRHLSYQFYLIFCQ